jgi:hypothetical protein
MTLTLTDPWGGSHTLTRQADGDWQGHFLWDLELMEYWIPDDVVEAWKGESS